MTDGRNSATSNAQLWCSIGHRLSQRSKRPQAEQPGERGREIESRRPPAAADSAASSSVRPAASAAARMLASPGTSGRRPHRPAVAARAGPPRRRRQVDRIGRAPGCEAAPDPVDRIGATDQDRAGRQGEPQRRQPLGRQSRQVRGRQPAHRRRVEGDVQRPVEPRDIGEIGKIARRRDGLRRRPGSPAPYSASTGWVGSDWATKARAKAPKKSAPTSACTVGKVAASAAPGCAGHDGGRRAAAPPAGIDVARRPRPARPCHRPPAMWATKPAWRSRSAGDTPVSPRASDAAGAGGLLEQHRERRNVGIPFDQRRPRRRSRADDLARTAPRPRRPPASRDRRSGSPRRRRRSRHGRPGGTAVTDRAGRPASQATRIEPQIVRRDDDVVDVEQQAAAAARAPVRPGIPARDRVEWAKPR